jgi:hypothetical protein
MVASGLEGPIPSSISALKTLTDLWVKFLDYSTTNSQIIYDVILLSEYCIIEGNFHNGILNYYCFVRVLAILCAGGSLT